MRYLIIILWLLLGLGYFFLASNCTSIDEVASSSITTLNKVEEPIQVPCPIIVAFAFERSSAELIINDHWLSYKDSLLRLLTSDKKIQIVGLEVEGEATTKYIDLGIARAQAIADKLALNEDNLQIYSSNIGRVNYRDDCKIPGAQIKLVTVSEKIKEIKDRTLIYFPYNSTNKLNDREVEAYLDVLALDINKTNKRIRLTGHTDNMGKPDYNMELGRSRAEVIKSYLISKGVPSENILSLSRGETLPISDNTKESGRAQNRRTELEIIK